MIRVFAAIVVALIATRHGSAAAQAAAVRGSIEVEAGPAVIALDLSHGDDQMRAAIAVGAALHIDPRVPIGLRGRVMFGSEGTSQRMLGIGARMLLRKLVIDTGLAITSVLGERSAIAGALQPRGLGLALDLRLGAVFGPVTLALFAAPTWVFASDATAREAALRSALGAGVAAGYAF